GEVAVLVPAAEDQEDARIRIPFERLARGIHVSSLRVVDPLNATPARDELRSMGKSVELGKSLLDRFPGGVEKIRRGQSRQGVLDVVRAGEGEAALLDDPALATDQRRMEPPLLRPRPESLPARSREWNSQGAGTKRRGDRIVGVDDRGVARSLVFENALLGPSVLFEARVSIEVIGRHVGQDGDVGTKTFD